MDTPIHKICTKCGPPAQPIDAFSINNARKSGRSSICKTCTSKKGKAYYADNKERLAPKYAEHRAENRESNRLYAKDYHAQNKDGKIATYLKTTRVKRLVKRAKWRDGHREEIQTYDAEHKPQAKKNHARIYLAKRKEILARNTKWRKANPEAATEIGRRRRARLKGAPVNDLAPAQWQEVLERENYRCVYCPPRCKACKEKTHVLTQDHMTALANHGSHTLWNVMPACLEHNSQKHTGNVLKPVQPFLLTEAPPHVPKRRKAS